MNEMINVEQLAVLFGVSAGRVKEAFRCGFIPRSFLSVKALRVVGPKRAKGYCLSKIKSAKYGFVYYVRYYHEGKMIPSRWSTRTNILEEAELFARENRESLIAGYLERKAAGNPANAESETGDLRLIENYYDGDSELLKEDILSGRHLNSRRRKMYDCFIKKRFVPFLKEKGIGRLDEITAPLVSEFRIGLLKQDVKRQTVNTYMCGVIKAFEHFAEKGLIRLNVFKLVKRLTVRESDVGKRGCHYVDSLKGVFDKDWDNRKYYLLNLLIHTTGMSNGEIERMKSDDIVKIDDCFFINVRQGKTKNRVRLQPLHKFVHTKIEEYITETGAGGDRPVFGKQKKNVFPDAAAELGKRLGKTKNDLKKENITFYSGRHYYKTLLNAEGLGSDIEEYFMGHAVSSDVKKTYNHKDRQGRKRMLAKAREVSGIFDNNLFAVQPSLFL